MKLFGKHCAGMLAILAFPGMVTCADITLPPPQRNFHSAEIASFVDPG